MATEAQEQAKKATRLLTASVKHSYDPRVDIDWDAPLEDGMFFISEHRISLYGTEFYESLSRAQRVVLSREQFAAVLATAIWIEHVLLHLVARYAYLRDVGTPEVQFALTEVGDEVRHMIMFARLIEKMGSKPYPIPRATQFSGLLLKTFAPLTALWAMLLLVEELLDRFQREQMDDESLQPIVRAVARIHVVEEARHITFARSELERVVPTLSKTRLELLRRFLAGFVKSLAQNPADPRVFERSGIDPKIAVAIAQTNPRAAENVTFGLERIAPYFQSIGLIGGKTESIWRATGALGNQ